MHLNRPARMGHSLRVLAAVLSCPDAARRGHLPEMRRLLHEERALAPARLRQIDALMQILLRTDALELESDYVALFDRGRATSLHLFEPVHVDSRDRGPAMIDLGQTFEKDGLILAEGELPDYLPAVLEFVSTQAPREPRAFLAEMAHIFNAIFSALVHRHSAHASVLGALIELAGDKAHAVAPAAEEPLDER